uniref:DWNN domain-containing protein n=1 Tax=Oryza brachyantha TaxID=4533 RepID=J3LNI7_ORYBR
MAVYYLYRSGVDTFSVPVQGPSVSVAELKRLIMATARQGHGRSRGRGPRETVALYGDRAGEEYTEEAEMIPTGSTVVVRRRVDGPPVETIVDSSLKKPLSQGGGGGSSSDSGVPSTEAEAVDEERAISAVIEAAELKWEAPSQGGHCYGHRSTHAWRAPPAGYVCHRCRVPGHFIHHCPTNGDRRFGIRRAGPAPASSTAPLASGDPEGVVVPAELYCKICQRVMIDAVLASKCCFDSFCDRCIITGKSKCACGAQARADDLIPNPKLRTTIANLLATIGATSGTEKPKSSAGSNAAEPAPHSPTASQASRSNVSSMTSTHSDGGATSTSKKSATISGVLGQRKARETDGDHSVESRSLAIDGNHHSAPFCPAPGYVDPFFGGMPFGAAYYGGVPYGCGGGAAAAYGYYGEEHRDMKRARLR